MKLLAAITVTLGLALSVVPGEPAFQAESHVRSQLEWFDRAGKQLSVFDALTDHGNIELSPDGKQVAVAVMDSNLNSRHIWLYDFDSGHRTQLTSTSKDDENWQIWSPDGLQILSNRFTSTGYSLFEKPARGGAENLVLSDTIAKWPVSWSPDGRYILYVTSSRTTGNDVWVLPLFGDRKPFPLFQTVNQEYWASFSPDGQWVAYSSTESGIPEVYVTSFPTPGKKWKISAGGGFQARWRRDGKEIFYIDQDDNITAATLKRQGSDFEVGMPERLFRIHIPYSNYRAYDVAPDGKRFLVNAYIYSNDSSNRLVQLH